MLRVQGLGPEHIASPEARLSANHVGGGQNDDPLFWVPCYNRVPKKGP